MNAMVSSIPLRTLLVLGLAASSAAAQSLMSQNHEVVMGVGDPIPGLAGATIFATGNFDSPVMDQNGTMLFRARMVGGGSTTLDDRAYFMGRGKADLQMVVRAGGPAPGLPGLLLGSATSSAGLSGSPRISPFGETLFFQSVVNPAATTADTAFFWGPASNLQLLVREGDQIPFLATGLLWGSFSASLQSTAINAQGQVLFLASIVGGSTTDDGLLITGLPGNLSIVSREGDVMPGGAVVIPVSGATQLSFVTQLNEAGQVLHEMRFSLVAPSTATTADDRALAIWTGGVNTLIAREGQQAPGLPAGVLFATPTFGWTPSAAGASFTKSGNTAITVALDGGGTTVGVDDSAIYYGGIGGLNLVVRRADATGLPNGELFGVTNNSSLTCNDAGQVAFINSLTGPQVTTTNESSIWAGSAGNLVLLAREGDAVPSSVLAPTPNGPWVYGQLNGGTNNPLLNGRGDVMFQASVSDTVTTKNVYLAAIAGLGLRLVLDNTDTFTTLAGPSTWTVVSSGAGFNGADGGQSHFNNSGDFAVRPNLTTGTAAVVRGHVGSLQAGPASIATAAGGTQSFAFDCGAARAFNIYALIASASGTRPGTPSPFGPQTIPLNFDVWTSLSLDLADTPVWTNTLSFLDGSGKGTASFNVPPALVGWPGTLHHAVVTLDISLSTTFVSEPVAVKLF